jgi:hypothetical protein
MGRRLWARFEVLPFRHGMALATGAVVLAGLLIAGTMTLGGGLAKHTASGRPSQRPVEAAAPPAPTWGAYVPPRETKPTPVPARPYIASVSPRPKHTSPRPTSTVTCPPTLKKWPWVWEMCKRKQSG